MQRRGFLATLGTSVTFPRGRRYQAIAAAQMPQTLHCPATAPIVEVRRYTGHATNEMAKLLQHHGAELISTDGLSFQLGFPNLESRQQMWAALIADPQWQRLRREADLTPTEIAIYEAI